MIRRSLSASSAAALTICCVAAAPSEASGRVRTADPRSLQAVFADAKGGDTIVLAPGSYVNMRLSGRNFSPPLTLDASKAQLTSLSVRKVGGLVIRGGVYGLGAPTIHPRTGAPVFGQALRMDDVREIKIIGARFLGPGGANEGDPFGEGHGVFITGGSGIRVEDGVFTGFASSLAMSKVDGFAIVGNAFRYMRSDGIQVGEGRRGLIERNTCEGTRIRSKEHPDCIQLWSRANAEPTSDVIIRGNTAIGITQGIGLFSKVRDGVDSGGFDRITIENNTLKVGQVHGIALYDGRDSIVRNNRVSTFPGAKLRASINLIGGSTKRCGNLVEAANGRSEIVDPPCQPE